MQRERFLRSEGLRSEAVRSESVAGMKGLMQTASNGNGGSIVLVDEWRMDMNSSIMMMDLYMFWGIDYL